MKNKVKLIITFILVLLFILLIILVKNENVAPIGPAGSEIGLSGINEAFHNLTGVNMGLYKLTQVLGIISLVVAFLFFLMGVIQLIQRKSLFKVDKGIISLGCLYIMLALVYVLFEKVVINYRPVLMEGEIFPEASFPSTHTMLSCVIFGSTIIVFCKYVKDKLLRTAVVAICTVLMVAMVIGRLMSGVHWLTDIIGGLLISGILLMIFVIIDGRRVKRGAAKRK